MYINMAAAPVRIYLQLSTNFFFKWYLNDTSLASMWTHILVLHMNVVFVGSYLQLWVPLQIILVN